MSRRLEYLKFLVAPVLVMAVPVAVIGYAAHRAFNPKWKGLLRR